MTSKKKALDNIIKRRNNRKAYCVVQENLIQLEKRQKTFVRLPLIKI